MAPGTQKIEDRIDDGADAGRARAAAGSCRRPQGRHDGPLRVVQVRVEAARVNHAADPCRENANLPTNRSNPDFSHALLTRLPVSEDTASKRGSFAETPIGFIHIDSCELRLAEGRLIMFLAIDRISKFTVVEFHESAGKSQGAAFLRHVVAAFPCKIHTVRTDNGMAFADLPNNRDRYPGMKALFGGHIFDRVCREHGIEHKLTKPYHPWTDGQAERMNRTIKDATSKTYHSPCRDALKAHVLAFVSAYRFAKHLKALLWRTPFQSICDAWQRDPSSFTINPHHLIPGPNT